MPRRRRRGRCGSLSAGSLSWHGSSWSPASPGTSAARFAAALGRRPDDRAGASASTWCRRGPTSAGDRVRARRHPQPDHRQGDRRRRGRHRRPHGRHRHPGRRRRPVGDEGDQRHRHDAAARRLPEGARRAQAGREVVDRGLRRRRRDPAMFTEDMAPDAMPRAGFAKDSVEVEGYVRGFARRRPDVARHHAAVRQLHRPADRDRRSPGTSRCRSCRRCSASTRGCSSSTRTTALEVLRCATRRATTAAPSTSPATACSCCPRRSAGSAGPTLPVPLARRGRDRRPSSGGRGSSTSRPSRSGSCTAGSSTRRRLRTDVRLRARGTRPRAGVRRLRAVARAHGAVTRASGAAVEPGLGALRG